MSAGNGGQHPFTSGHTFLRETSLAEASLAQLSCPIVFWLFSGSAMLNCDTIEVELCLTLQCLLLAMLAFRLDAAAESELLQTILIELLKGGLTTSSSSAPMYRALLL